MYANSDFRQQVERLWLESGPHADGREPPPGDACPDPVRAQQRLEAASRAHLTAAERAVDVRTRDRTAGLDLGQQVVQGFLHARTDALAERSLQRAGVRGHFPDRVDHLVGDLAQRGAQYARDLGR